MMKYVETFKGDRTALNISSFPADGHQAILNKMNKTSKPNRKRTNTNN